MVTPRRRGPPAAPPPSLPPAAPALTPPERQMIKGDKGDPGSPGPRGPSALHEISESGSTELYGSHPSGFACLAHGAPPIQCSFKDWQPGDILEIEFWVQLALSDPSGSLIVQAQLSTNGGSEWHAISGARAAVAVAMSASASSSVALPALEGSAPPLVRLHAAHSWKGFPDYGPGPEGATLLLRCTRWAAGTYEPTGKLTPPRT